jgi:hypothetical protein
MKKKITMKTAAYVRTEFEEAFSIKLLSCYTLKAE